MCRVRGEVMGLVDQLLVSLRAWERMGERPLPGAPGGLGSSRYIAVLVVVVGNFGRKRADAKGLKRSRPWEAERPGDLMLLPEL